MTPKQIERFRFKRVKFAVLEIATIQRHASYFVKLYEKLSAKDIGRALREMVSDGMLTHGPFGFERTNKGAQWLNSWQPKNGRLQRVRKNAHAGKLSTIVDKANEGGGDERKKSNSRHPKLKKIDLAIMQLRQCPEWTNLQIAKAVGCKRETLSRSIEFKRVRAILKNKSQQRHKNKSDI